MSDPKPGKGRERPKPPPKGWYAVATISLLLVVAGSIANLAGGGVALIAIGFPGALGMLASGLWLRRHRAD